MPTTEAAPPGRTQDPAVLPTKPPWPEAWTSELRRLAAVVSVAAPPDVSRVIVEEARRATGADAALLFLVSPGGGFLEIAHAVGVPAISLEHWQRFPLSAAAPACEAVRTRQVVVCSSKEVRERFPEMAATPHLVLHPTRAAIPLMSDDVCVGCLGLTFHRRRRFGPRRLAFFRAVADHFAQALHRARLVERERLSTARLYALAQASRAFAAAAPNVSSVAKAVVDQVVATLGSSCTLAALSPDGAWLDALETRDVDPVWEDRLRELSNKVRVPRGHGLSGVVLETGRSLLMPEVAPGQLERQTLGQVRKEVEALEVKSLLIVPLKASGQPIGTISTWQRRPGRSFAEEDRTLLEDLADRAALALANARMHEKERQARELAQKTDRQKDEFLATLGHELRGPLAPVWVAVQIMREIALGDERLIWARDTISRQVAHFARLVDDLLDVSRINLGMVDLRLASVELAAVAQQALEASRPLFSERRHEVSVQLSPVNVRGDAGRLTQVISNLLHNAGKYTDPEGHVSLTVARVNEEAVITVRDDGLGIPADMIERVFEPFVQIEASRGRSREGLGIGLTLVKRLVEMHGGAVRASSGGAGQGSRFEVRLPVLVPASAAVATRAAEPTGPASTPARRILVADDTVDVAQGLQRLLSLQGHQVEVVHGGAAALDVAARLQPDVVVLDVDLPDMDGLQIARTLRARDLTKRPLLVAITGMGRAEDRERTAAAGFDHHLVKPIDLASLTSLIARWDG
jgi:signal transduction histidine kinase